MSERDLIPSGDNRTLGPSSITAANLGSRANNLEAILQVGTLLGGRYEILEMLGLGGMGAVYKARDLELDRLIALKVILPGIARDSNALARFRQELLTARQVSHKNVVRIFDIGEAGGIRFITMEYVAGKDLRGILVQRGKIPIPEALAIMRQICAALEAAHAEGVIHRDLKPGNIMLDEQGRIVVMDFGLARSLEDAGHLTQTGAMLGTLDYMSPEQALGEKLDARSDLFTIGLIFYELLTGKIPYGTEATPLASLVKRTQQRAIAAIEVDQTIPKALSDIVARCLERDPAQRFQSAREIIDCLDAYGGRRSSSSIAPAPAPSRRKPWVAIALTAAAVVALGVGVTWLLRDHGQQAAMQRPVSVLLADFSNATSDDVFDGTLEPAFALALEGAPFITAYNRSQARKELNQINPGSPLNPANAQLLAVRNGINVVISGSVAKEARGYMLTCTVTDAVSGKTISTERSEVEDKSAALKAVGSLAAKIRRDLGDTKTASGKLAQETFTSDSIEAAHAYAQAQESRYAGKTDDAIQGFKKSIELDPKFGTAYAGLAAMYANLGRRDSAKQYYQLAMQHEDRMTQREKYRTRGGYYLATLDAPHAVEEFTALTNAYPADNMGHSALAFAYYLRRDIAKAIEEGRRALEIYPKNVPYRNNVALYSLYAGDFTTAETEASRALSDNPSYLKAYITTALSQIGLGDHAKAFETYNRLALVNTTGASFAASGLADVALYEGRNKDAIDILNKAIASDLQNESKDAAAKKMVLLAEAHYASGDKKAASASVEKALSTNRSAVLFSAARLLAELGEFSRASSLADELGAQLEQVPQAQSKLIAGEISLRKNKNVEAVQLLQSAIGVSDLWLARYDLGRAYLAAKAYPQADSEFVRCVNRQGEASDVFLDEMPTFHYLPPVFYYHGQVREGQGDSAGAREIFRKFLAMKNKTASDALVADAKKRLE